MGDLDGPNAVTNDNWEIIYMNTQRIIMNVGYKVYNIRYQKITIKIYDSNQIKVLIICAIAKCTVITSSECCKLMERRMVNDTKVKAIQDNVKRDFHT